jgi:hypothetical protein
VDEAAVYSLDDFRRDLHPADRDGSSAVLDSDIAHPEVLPAFARVAVDALTVREDAEPPFDKLTALLAADRRFRKTWERSRSDLADRSASGWDMALADAAAEAGWSDQEITNLLIAHRRKHGNDLKLLRADYFARTIEKARLLHGDLEELLAQATSPEDRHALICAHVSAHLGVSVLGMIRHPGPPSTYRLKTDLGEIPLATVGDITTFPRFRNHIADQTGHLLAPMTPARWHPIAAALLQLCEDDVISDLTERGRVAAWIEGYLDEREVFASIEEGVATRSPFTESSLGGRLCLFGDDLHGWLVTRRLEQVRKREMESLLRAYGCELVAPKVEIDGKRTTRSVWCLPPDPSDPLGQSGQSD